MIPFRLQLPMGVGFALSGNTMWAPRPVVSMCGVMLLYLCLSGFVRSSERPNGFASRVLHNGLLVATFYNARFIIRGDGCWSSLIHWAYICGAYRCARPWPFSAGKVLP